jgi:hypothetical protein
MLPWMSGPSCVDRFLENGDCGRIDTTLAARRVVSGLPGRTLGPGITRRWQCNRRAVETRRRHRSRVVFAPDQGCRVRDRHLRIFLRRHCITAARRSGR